MIRKRSLIGILLAVLLAVSLLVSLDFIAENTQHECSGQDCEICATLHTAEGITGGVKQCAAVILAIAAVFATVACAKSAGEPELACATPVSRCDVLTN